MYFTESTATGTITTDARIQLDAKGNISSTLSIKTDGKIVTIRSYSATIIECMLHLQRDQIITVTGKLTCYAKVTDRGTPYPCMTITADKLKFGTKVIIRGIDTNITKYNLLKFIIGSFNDQDLIMSSCPYTTLIAKLEKLHTDLFLPTIPFATVELKNAALDDTIANKKKRKVGTLTAALQDELLKKFKLLDDQQLKEQGADILEDTSCNPPPNYGEKKSTFASLR
ncbi:hypothetical protein [Parasitella parasitica]|uniref:Uncharacterized protein n=1 Tax=Parasitella parasitica TaxID=35722 RepID=A0A0B7NFG0_9FUNG|nr:hypothetical protein [Parasitella parasitica]